MGNTLLMDLNGKKVELLQNVDTSKSNNQIAAMSSIYWNSRSEPQNPFCFSSFQLQYRMQYKYTHLKSVYEVTVPRYYKCNIVTDLE